MTLSRAAQAIAQATEAKDECELLGRRGVVTDSLERYLETDYQSDRALVEQMRRLTGEVLGVFVRTFRDESDTWPYELVTEREPEASTTYSFSTTAMIVFALSVALGKVRGSSLVPAATRNRLADSDSDEMHKIEGLIDRALDGLIRQSRGLPDELIDQAPNDLPPPGRDPLVQSATFGWDDPFTLTWLVEVLWDDKDPTRRAYCKQLSERSWNLVERVLGTADKFDPFREVLLIKEHQQVSHSFPLLRLLQLGDTLSRKERGDPLNRTADLSQIREVLFERVHLHLSESLIPDSEFDAADLVFSVEGWMLTSPVEPDLAVLTRAFDVLRESQEHTPYWRPLRPFKATSQGLVLLPQSVEIANSLLRICDSPGLAPFEYFSTNAELLRGYARWLMGRVFRGFASSNWSEGSRFVGWESEHTFALDRIHLWQSSQAVIFLQLFGSMLQRYVARTSLRMAGFRPPPIERKDASDPVQKWGPWRLEEPLSSLLEGSPYRVHDQIVADFVKPRVPGTSGVASFSMLLHGPPGTGKTTIAESLAQALGFDLVIVTPSDFITAGGEAVEARAKAIFQVLREQTDLVVLFDEVDHLLLDRESAEYSRQGDIFQLLTPGMLTKLNDLAKQRRVVFVIATNYYERIDRAIKRPGRIDARFLVMPPDRVQRSAHLAREVHGWDKIPADRAEEIARATVRFTFKELGDLAGHVQRRHPDAEGEDLAVAFLRAIQQLPPVITLGGYDTRLRAADSVDRPWEEFALLAYLEIDAHNKLPDRPDWLVEMLRDALDRGAVTDPAVVARLEAALP